MEKDIENMHEEMLSNQRLKEVLQNQDHEIRGKGNTVIPYH